MRFLVFTGLRHHLEKLRPVLDELDRRGHEVHVVTDQNFWAPASADFELALRDGGVAYRMLAEIREDPAFAERLTELRRESARATSEAFAAGATPPWWLNGMFVGYALAEALEHQAAFSVLMERLEIDAAIALQEGNFWARCLSAACDDAGLPLFTFQEGLLADILPLSLVRELGLNSRRIFLWGETARERMVTAGVDAARLRVAGPAHLDSVCGESRPSQADARRILGLPADGRLLLLAAPTLQIWPLPIDFMTALAAHLAPRGDDIHLVAKWNPTEGHASRDDLEDAADDLLGHRFHVLDRHDPLLALLAADCVLGASTTLAAEAIALDRPFIELTWGGAAAGPVGFDLALHAGAQRVAGPDDLRLIDAYLEGWIPDQVRATNAAFRTTHFGPLDGHATTRCVDGVLAELTEPQPA